MGVRNSRGREEGMPQPLCLSPILIADPHQAGTGGKEKKKGDEERIYVLVAASNEDREKWVEALNKCRDQIKGRDTKKAQMSSSVL